MTMNNLKSLLLTLSIGAFATASYAQTATSLTVADGVTKDIFGEIYVDSQYNTNQWGGDENYTFIDVQSGGTLNIEDGSNFYMYSQSDYDKSVPTVKVSGTMNFNVSDPAYSGMYLFAGRMYVYGKLNTNAYTEIGTDGKAYLNVGGENAVATFGDINIFGGTYSNLRVDNNATLNANTIYVGANNNESSAGLSVNWGGKINAKAIYAGNNAKIDFGEGTINVDNISVAGQSKTEKGKLNLYTGSTLNINDGRDSVLAGVDLQAGATLNIKAGRVQTFGDNAFLMTGGTLNIANNASMMVADAKLADENNQYTFSVGKGTNNQINLKGNAYLHTASSQSGNDFKVGQYSGGKVDVYINAGRQGAIVADKVTFVNNGTGADGTIHLNNKNIFVKSSAYDTTLFEYKEGYQNDMANFRTQIVLGSAVSAEIVVNADSAFGEVSYQKDCDFTITLGDSGVVSFTQFAQGYAFENTSYAKLSINEFENNRIFIQNMEDVGAMVGTKKPDFIVSISATLSDAYLKSELNQNRTYTNDDFQMVAGEWNGMQGFWLNIPAAVPEPAEWAMIFGGIALAFAMYRKRK